MNVRVVQTNPIEGQKTGTSGLRKKVAVFKAANYLENWVQSLFFTLRDLKQLEGATLVVGGDGRYWNQTALQKIIKVAPHTHTHTHTLPPQKKHL